jgi:hypothetical protein
MKRQAHKKRSERQFTIGDMVFVKLQPYVQSTLAPRSNQKLSFKFYGPFKIVERIGSVAYKLLLPPSSAILSVFHVSQLKAAVLPHEQVSPSLPADIELPRVPMEVLQRCVIPTATGSVEQGLILWSGWPSEMATWENLLQLRQAFPRAPAWGQAGTKAPGSVTSPSTTTISENAAHGPRVGSRNRRPNVRLAGAEWM